MQNIGTANRKMPNTGGWQDRHDAAWNAAGARTMSISAGNSLPYDPAYLKQVTEQSLAAMLHHWRVFAIAHQATHESKIGDDGFLGPQWLEIGKGLRALLNGETGRLDCGTVDGFILDTLTEAGFSENDL